MPSIVYVLTNPAMPGLVKIGYSGQDDANARIAQLYTSGVPFPFRLEYACHVENPAEVEQALHTAFAPNRVNARREFFSIESGQAIAILKLLHTENATPEVILDPLGATQQDFAAGEQFRAHRPNFNFVEMGIPTGSILASTATDAEVTVCGPRKVSFEGEDVYLTFATRKILGLNYSVQPGPYWRFNGKLLSQIYEETYPVEE